MGNALQHCYPVLPLRDYRIKIAKQPHRGKTNNTQLTEALVLQPIIDSQDFVDRLCNLHLKSMWE